MRQYYWNEAGRPNVVTSEKGEIKKTWNKKANLTLVLHPNFFTGELMILLRIETDYRSLHIFNKLSAHESSSTLKHE